MGNENQIQMETSVNSRVIKKTTLKFPVVINYPRIASHHRIICDRDNTEGVGLLPGGEVLPGGIGWNLNMDVPRRIEFAVSNYGCTVEIEGKNASGKDIVEGSGNVEIEDGYKTKNAFLYIKKITFGKLDAGSRVTALLGGGFGMPYDLSTMKILGVSLSSDAGQEITPVNEGEITVDEEYSVVEFDPTVFQSYNGLTFFLTGKQIYNAYKHPTQLPSVPLNFQGEEKFLQNELTWEMPTNGRPITGYNIYRAEEGDPLVLYDTIADFLYYVNLMDESEAGTSFDYAVSALNELGEGPLTGIVTLTVSDARDRYISGYNDLIPNP